MDKIGFKEVEAVLFDFEGTLVDIQWNLNGAVQETLERLKAMGFPMERLVGKKYSLLKNEAMAIAQEIGRSPDSVKEEIDSIYDRFDADALSRWSLRPEAKDFLHSLKTSGIRIALVSNVGAKALQEAMKKLELSSFFHTMVSRNDVTNLKPNGEGIRLALTRLRASAKRVLFIGDSIDDIEAAKETGLRVIILLGGENPRPDLLSRGPDFLVRDYSELIAALKEDRR